MADHLLRTINNQSYHTTNDYLYENLQTNGVFQIIQIELNSSALVAGVAIFIDTFFLSSRSIATDIINKIMNY